MPPLTRSRRARDAAVETPNWLLELPGELTVEIARQLLALDLPTALRLCQSCRQLHERLATVRAEAEARRLRWLPELADGHVVKHDGRSLTGVTGPSDWMPVAAANLLPTTGVSSWTLRVAVDDHNEGFMDLGVCDADGKNAWGFNLLTGKIRRASKQNQPSWLRTADPPDGYPDGDDTEVVRQGVALKAAVRPKGAEITVVVDHDAGTLGFRFKGVKRRKLLHAVAGFPRGTLLRPHASLFFSPKDTVSFVRPYL
jgi:hypothetical protein